MVPSKIKNVNSLEKLFLLSLSSIRTEFGLNWHIEFGLNL